MQYCSLQHRTLRPSPVTSTTGHCVCFGSVSSFFLELFLHCSPVAYWAPANLGSSSFSVLSFCLFILFMGFSRQEYWSGLPFPSPVDHIFQNSPPWPILLGWPYTAWLTVSLSYTRLWSLWSVWLVFCDCGFHSALWWIRRGLWKLPDGRYCFTFNLSHFTAEETVPRKLSIFSKALQFSLSAQTRRWVSQFLVYNTFAAICNLNLYS